MQCVQAIADADREITDHVENVATANSVACHHGDHWLGKPPYLDLQDTMQNLLLLCICISHGGML